MDLKNFLKTDIFVFRFQKKYASTQRIGIVLARPYENAKQWNTIASLAEHTSCQQ